MAGYKYFLIKSLVEAKNNTYDELVKVAKDSNHTNCRALLKAHLDGPIKITYGIGNNVTDDELEEIFVLVKTGTVEITLAEFENYRVSAKGPSDPPLVWRT